MNKTLAIARREFLCTVLSWGYILSVIALPVIMAGVGMLFLFVMDFDELVDDLKTPEKIAIVDPSGIINQKLARQMSTAMKDGTDAAYDFQHEFVFYNRLDSALQDIRGRDIKSCFMIDTHYPDTNVITAYSRKSGFLKLNIASGQGDLYKILKISLLAGRVDTLTIQRVLKPGELDQYQISASGGVGPARGWFETLGGMFNSLFIGFFLALAIFGSAAYMMETIVEDKENRVFEIMLSSVTPRQLIAGKMIGLGGASLLPLVFYLPFIIPGLLVLKIVFDFKLSLLFVWGIYFILGYILYCTIFTGVGILGMSVRQSQQTVACIMLLLPLPLFYFLVFTDSYHTTPIRILSYIPVMTPMIMMIRSGQPDVPAIDIAGTLLVLALSAWFSFIGVSKIFRTGALMYGKAPRLAEIYRWFKES